MVNLMHENLTNWGNIRADVYNKFRPLDLNTHYIQRIISFCETKLHGSICTFLIVGPSGDGLRSFFFFWLLVKYSQTHVNTHLSLLSSVLYSKIDPLLFLWEIGAHCLAINGLAIKVYLMAMIVELLNSCKSACVRKRKFA